MSVQEIKAVIADLPLSDLADFARWFERFQQEALNREGAQSANGNPLEAQAIRKPRVAGLHKGAAWISEDFDQPLAEEFWTGVS